MSNYQLYMITGHHDKHMADSVWVTKHELLHIYVTSWVTLHLEQKWVISHIWVPGHVLQNMKIKTWIQCFFYQSLQLQKSNSKIHDMKALMSLRDIISMSDQGHQCIVWLILSVLKLLNSAWSIQVLWFCWNSKIFIVINIGELFPPLESRGTKSVIDKMTMSMIDNKNMIIIDNKYMIIIDNKNMIIIW